MNRLGAIGLIFLLFVNFSGSSHAADSSLVVGKATPEEVVEKAREAAKYIARTGKDGLGEFEKPNGRFVWKNTYVWVTQCEENYCLPGPRSREEILIMGEMKCYKTGRLYILDLCDQIMDGETGAWTEYWEMSPDDPKFRRRVIFMLQVPDQPYQVVAGIPDEAISIEELSKISKRK